MNGVKTVAVIEITSTVESTMSPVIIPLQFVQRRANTFVFPASSGFRRTHAQYNGIVHCMRGEQGNRHNPDGWSIELTNSNKKI